MKQKSIFLVEDDIEDQEFFIEALSAIENTNMYGVANNGKEALAMLKNSIAMPDHIFMDFNMPIMNGIECLKEIGKNPQTRAIPVAILSGSIEQAGPAGKLGAAFIRKSPEIEELRTQLNRIINLNITVNYVISDQPVSVKYGSGFNRTDD